MIALPTSVYQSAESCRQVSARFVHGADFYQTPSCPLEINSQGRGKDPSSVPWLKGGLLHEPSTLSSPGEATHKWISGNGAS